MLGLEKIINVNNLKKNIKTIKNHIEQDIIAVLKANAYNHDLNVILPKLLKLGISFFAVGNINEAKIIRNLSEDSKILLLFPLTQEEVLVASDLNCHITVYDGMDLSSFKLLKKPIYAHLNINVGMNRFGLDVENDYYFSFINELNKNSNLIIDGIYTHFSNATDNNNTNIQYEKFLKQIAILEENGFTFKYKHCQNSIATSLYKFPEMTHVRIGSLMYGIDETLTLSLKQVMYLYGEIVSIRKIYKGQSVAYNTNYVANEDFYMGIVSFGYSNGYIFNESVFNQTVVVGHKKMKVITVSMNHTFIKLDKFYPVGTKAFINNDEYKMTEVINKNIPVEYIFFLK